MPMYNTKFRFPTEPYLFKTGRASLSIHGVKPTYPINTR